MSVTTCEAVREGDEMVCVRCRLRWDVSDTKPECRPVALKVPTEHQHYCGCRFDTVLLKWTFACRNHLYRLDNGNQ